MGAFFLYHKYSQVNIDTVKSIFEKKGFRSFKKFEFDDYSLLLYGKISININNYFEENANGIYVSGTLVYKGLDYALGIRTLLTDFLNNKIDHEQLLGNYFVLFKKSGKLSYLIDAFGLYNVFFNKKFRILSSSFLALFVSICNQDVFTYNKKAILEVLLTGALIGPDTWFNEIYRFEKESVPVFDSLNFIGKGYKNNTEIIKTRVNKKAITNQINRLNKYFTAIQKIADSHGVTAGITGGYDSRLLMAFVIKHFKRFQFYTFWRAKPDKDVIAANEICNNLNLIIKSIPITPFSELNEISLNKTLEEAFYFNDGLVRSECYWTEQYNTLNHKIQILRNSGLSLNGIGGEQYRNAEKMILPAWLINNWITYELILKYAGNCFISKKALNDFRTYYKQKIINKLDLSKKDLIFKNKVAQYFNEIYNISCRTARNNAENQISFCLSPFADPYLSLYAYNIINNKGWGGHFQGLMINILNPILASIKSSYGYSFDKREPIITKVIILMKELLPFKVYNFLYRVFKNKKKSSINQSVLADVYIKEVEKLGLPVKLNKINNNELLYPLVISTGYFLNKINRITEQYENR